MFVGPQKRVADHSQAGVTGGRELPTGMLGLNSSPLQEQ